MGYFVGFIDLHNTPGGEADQWEVGSPLSYITTAGHRITVLPGARTDGASVPRIFWRLAPPFAGRYIAAALIHDQLYKTRGAMGLFDRAECDGVFHEAMRAAGVNPLLAGLMYAAVRIGGGRFEDKDPAQAKTEMKYIDAERSELWG
jgi:hypothetical protein